MRAVIERREREMGGGDESCDRKEEGERWGWGE